MRCKEATVLAYHGMFETYTGIIPVIIAETGKRLSPEIMHRANGGAMAGGIREGGNLFSFSVAPESSLHLAESFKI